MLHAFGDGDTLKRPPSLPLPPMSPVYEEPMYRNGSASPTGSSGYYSPSTFKPTPAPRQEEQEVTLDLDEERRLEMQRQAMVRGLPPKRQPTADQDIEAGQPYHDVRVTVTGFVSPLARPCHCNVPFRREQRRPSENRPDGLKW